MNKGAISSKLLLLLIGVLLLIVVLYFDTQQGNMKEEPVIDSEEHYEEVQPEKEEPLHISNKIRVLIKTNGYAGNYHSDATFICDAPMTVTLDGVSNELPAGHEISMKNLSNACHGFKKVSLCAMEDVPIKLSSIRRTQGIPAYCGSFDVYETPNGFVVVNEVLLEEYLYSVVTSEMPSEYPIEALKAQAICARSYAARQMNHPAYQEYEADVDDSNAYQVYNNIGETQEAKAAVTQTKGIIAYYQQDIANTYYFSTSCGMTTNDEVWRNIDGYVAQSMPYLKAKSVGNAYVEASAMSKNYDDELEFNNFIHQKQETDYECEEPWYRWKAVIYPQELNQIADRLREREAVNPSLVFLASGYDDNETKLPEELGRLEDLKIVHRNAGGLLDEICLVFEKCEVCIKTEYNIRYILADETVKVTKQDGSEAVCANLLPSAYFVPDLIRDKKDGILKEIRITGGGYGHGVGMSQNGAKIMAQNGMKYEDIMKFYYEGISLGLAYEE